MTHSPSQPQAPHLCTLSSLPLPDPPACPVFLTPQASSCHHSLVKTLTAEPSSPLQHWLGAWAQKTRNRLLSPQRCHRAIREEAATTQTGAS